MPTVTTMRTQVAKAETGIMMEFVRKSKKVRISMPKMVKEARGPNPSEEREPSTIIRMNTAKVEKLRLQPHSSWKVETLVSAREIAEVRAAKRTSVKNTTPTRVPSPMLAKTFGMVMNMSDGPAFSMDGSPPEKAKTAGMIIRLARTEIPESKAMT